MTDIRRLDADIKLFRASGSDHLFVADGSRIYDIERSTAARLETALADTGDAHDASDILKALGLHGGRRRIQESDPIEIPEVRALSLNVSQACNMSCGYCYADKGQFGGRARLMPSDIARRAVDRLFTGVNAGERVVLGFMGGEPLLARAVVHEAAKYAAERAREHDICLGFSITTNASLITEADARLFQEHEFSVTVSIDGTPERHRSNRRMNDGSDSYAAMTSGLEQLLRVGRPRQLSARATVTAGSGRLLPLLDHMIALGVDDAGFSAVYVSPDRRLEFSRGDFDSFLESMIECGEKAMTEIKAGRSYPFANFETALQEIHRGTHRPFPCGAGAGYLSVSAEGKLFACHRLIDDPRFAMGNLATGPDRPARERHLANSHVDRQEPCGTCWARYLCGGGCHHEVAMRGRFACDYIRGWLEFCLKAYVRLTSKNHSAPISDPRPSS